MQLVSVNTYLSRVAILNNQDLPYVVWCLLRQDTTNNNLSGKYTKKDARYLARAYGLSLSVRTWTRIWRAGDGIFWGTDNNNIFLRSMKRVTKWACKNDASKSEIDVQMYQVSIAIDGSLQAIKASLYWSWFAARDEVTIARDTISDIFGLSHDTQRAYEALLGAQLLVKSNYAHIDESWHIADTKACQGSIYNLPGHARTFEQEKFSNDRVSKDRVIMFQLPNTYIARGSKGGSPAKKEPQNSAVSAIWARRRFAVSCLQSERTYCKNHDIWAKYGTKNSFWRAYYQGKKRVWKSGQFS